MMVVRLESSGTASLDVVKRVSGSDTVLKTTVLSGYKYSAGEKLQIHFEVAGGASVKLTGKVWRAGKAKPSSPTVSVTDSSSTLKNGALGLKMYTGGGTSLLPLKVSVADYQAATR